MARILDRLFVTELHNFLKHFEIFDLNPVPCEQYMRASVVGWIATFSPESISKHGREELYIISSLIHERQDFRYFGWHRVPYLDIAMFSIYWHLDRLSTIICNLDHYKSTLRRELHAPLGLFAPKMSFKDGELFTRIESCMRSSLFYNDSLICILYALNDATDVKLNLIKR